MFPIKIAIIGLGTVGYSLYKLIRENNYSNIEIVSLCDIDENTPIYKKDSKVFCTDYRKAIDSDADIIIELIGGENPAYKIIKTSIENSKNIITANKSLLAKKGKSLFNTAKKYNQIIKYEAAVGGAIPIISNLKELKKIDKIISITGILNGTTNYILTKMYRKNISYKIALELAQKNGFAEKDPTLDVSGRDTLYKTILLVFTAFNRWLDPSQIQYEGITQLVDSDIKYLKKSNRKPKLIGSIEKKDDNELDVKVSVKEIDRYSDFFNIDNEYNGINIYADNFNSLFFAGKGAGGFPTATSVLKNIIEFQNQ